MTNEQLALITSDPLVLHGRARVVGTRVTVIRAAAADSRRHVSE